jgi:hypothetical protein
MTRVSIPITEHVDDYDGDWQRALMGVVYATCPAAEVVGERIFQNRGRPNLNVFLPDGVDAEAEAARIGAACDEHIKRARRKAALDAMRAIDAVAQLPDGLEPEDKGALLLEYVRHGTPVDGLDFSMVLMPPGTDISDANLKGGRFRHGVFEGVRLDGADLRGAELRHSRAAGASLDRALLHEADLRHVDLKGGTLRHAELHRARADHVRLLGADLTGADLRDSDLRNAYSTTPPSRMPTSGAC